jgi:hypothetical protein
MQKLPHTKKTAASRPAGWVLLCASLWLLPDAYALCVSDFGQNLTGAAPARLSELLKG